jgi:spore coat polysaccharide biosynthesis protein SpsF
MQIGVIIQARLGSTRLKNKMVIPFYAGQSILEILLSKLQNSIHEIPIVLATTSAPQDKAIESIAQDFNIPCYRGSEENVLDRFIKTAETHKFDSIIRICADNPFLDIDLINALFKASEITRGADYISFWTENKTPVIKTHFGFFAEMVSLSALKKVAEQTQDNLFIEHVTNYIYTNSDKFKLEWLELPDYLKSRNDIRLTIDTEIDFKNGQKILSESNKAIEDLKTQEIIEIIDSDETLKILMTEEIDKNSK